MTEPIKLLAHLMYGLYHSPNPMFGVEKRQQVLPGCEETHPASGGERTQGRVSGGGKDLPYVGRTRKAAAAKLPDLQANGTAICLPITQGFTART